MKYTNKLNLPQYLYDWLVRDNYDYSAEAFTLSATTLMKPVRAHWLSVRHGKDLETDVSELLSARYGTAIHDSIEKVNSPNVLKEQRTTKKINPNGQEYSISGKYDVLVFENGIWTLRDIKTTSVWAYIYGGKDDDYQKQLSIYRWLLNDKQVINDVAYIDFFFTDWQSSKAKQEEGYPPYRVAAGYKINLLSIDATNQYVFDRVSEFDKYRDVIDEDLPQCSKQELWSTEDSFAIYKPGLKRATKVCATKLEAEVYIKDHGIKSAGIEMRPGKVKRCKYCAAAPYCSQFSTLANQGLIDNY